MNLKKYINKGMSFQQYYQHIDEVIAHGNKEEATYPYYELNKTRIERLQKKFEVSEENLEKIKGLKNLIYLVVITEGWCGDAAQILPIIEGICAQSDFIEARIVLRDENTDLMQEYLTNGNQSIPIVIGIDESGEEKFHWGPRPAWADEILKAYKNDEISKNDFLIQIQKKYNQDKGKSIENELIELMLR